MTAISLASSVVIKNANCWQQWDKQEERRLQNAAYIQLNNLYLSIERGCEKLTITLANKLRILVDSAYDRDDPMRDWWMSEFTELPRWFDV